MKNNNIIYNCFLKLEQSTVLVSIRQGFIMMMPVFMTGAIALMILNFPVPSFQDFINTFWNGRLSMFLNLLYESTFGLASVFLLITVTYKYSSNIIQQTGILNILSCIVAIASYISILGIKPEIMNNNASQQVILLTGLNVQSIFSALVCSVLSTRLFLFLFRKTSAFFDFTEFSIDIDYRTALRTLLPMMLTISIFAVTSLLIKAVFDVAGLNEIIAKLFVAPFEKLGRSVWSGLLILFMQSLLWFFGIHGSNAFETVNLTVFNDIHGEVIIKTFFDVFVLMGGCGTSICLIISIFLFSKLKVQKSLGKCALIPVLFNINEILVFGLPIVLNPLMFIPFILTPLVSFSVSYVAVISGLVPAVVRSVAWTTPVFFSGFIATGSIRGLLLQVFIITVGIFIYAPFIILGNRLHGIKTAHLVKEMSDHVKITLDKGCSPALFSRNDYLSKAAKELAFELRKSIEKKEIELFYQPQHDNSGQIVAAEALLRWKYLNLEYIFPPLVLEIAKEDESFSSLTDCIIEKAINDTSLINSEFGKRISISINIDSAQLNNLDLIKRIIGKVKERNIIDNTFGIELTEECELKDQGHLSEAFAILRDNKIKLAIDDFSTGHTSLVYLQSNKFDYVKLDGSLVRKLMTNERSLDIIKSIVDLGKSLDFDVIAEYVENEEQKNILKNIGCSKYQGYLYSPPLSLPDFIKYTKKSMNKTVADISNNN